MDRSSWTRRRFGSAAGGCLASVMAARTADAGGRWKFVAREGGVTVTTRREKNRQFPTFRGTTRLDCDPWDVVAIVHDAPRHVEWAHACVESKTLKEIDTTTSIIYTRTDVPWPAKDRDVVVKGRVDVLQPDVELRIRFNTVSTSLAPVKDGLIRIPHLEGHWYLVKMKDKTLAEYQVNADPGGALPEWIVEQGSRDLPLITVKTIKKQLAKTRASGVYRDWIAKARAFKQGT